MKEFSYAYKTLFSQKRFVWSLILGFALLFLSLIVNFYAGTFATEHASQSVTDLVLDHIPVFDVDYIFIYGPLFVWIVVAFLGFKSPQKMPFILKSIALFIFIRAGFITLTHIGPFPDQIKIGDTGDLINKFTFGGDLFFSAHTGLPFLMALVFGYNRDARAFFVLCAVFFGFIVLMAHLHYTIDVLSAFFITYTIYHIAIWIFPSDFQLFHRNKVS